MTQTLSILLSAHVFISMIGIIASYMTVMWLFKRNIPVRSLRVSSLITFIAYITAWIIGGYYYVVYYGGNVKPIIRSGSMPWAHLIIMEVKEHIFYFLPILSFIIFLIIWLHGYKLQENRPLRNALALIAIITLVIGVLVALGGVVISGAAR